MLQLHNLGFFPVDGVTIKITIPVATRGGNRLLLLTNFIVDQVAVLKTSTFGMVPGAAL